MSFYWHKYRVWKVKLHVFWIIGPTNLASYHTGQHSASHHMKIQRTLLKYYELTFKEKFLNQIIYKGVFISTPGARYPKVIRRPVFITGSHVGKNVPHKNIYSSLLFSYHLVCTHIQHKIIII